MFSLEKISQRMTSAAALLPGTLFFTFTSISSRWWQMAFACHQKKKWQFLWQMSAMTQSRTLSRAFALSHLKVLSIKSSGTGKDHNRNPLLPVTWSDEQNKIKIPALQSYFAALRSKSTLGKTKWRKKNQKDELLCHPLYPTDFYLF